MKTWSSFTSRTLGFCAAISLRAWSSRGEQNCETKRPLWPKQQIININKKTTGGRVLGMPIRNFASSGFQ